jgi:hypothetical protein
MKTTIPAKTVLTCDKCGKEVAFFDVVLEADVQDRDFSGCVVYGHKEHFDFCYNCGHEALALLRTFCKTNEPVRPERPEPLKPDIQNVGI